MFSLKSCFIHRRTMLSASQAGNHNNEKLINLNKWKLSWKYFNRWLKKTLPRWSRPRGVVNYWKSNSLDSRACLWLQQTSRSCVMIPAISLWYRSTRLQSFRSVHLNAATWNSCSWKIRVNFDSLMALCQPAPIINWNEFSTPIKRFKFLFPHNYSIILRPWIAVGFRSPSRPSFFA